MELRTLRKCRKFRIFYSKKLVILLNTGQSENLVLARKKSYWRDVGWMQRGALLSLSCTDISSIDKVVWVAT